MKDNYIRQRKDATGKQTVYTEIEINASPEVVKSKFFDFEKWGTWNKVHPKIAVKSGNLNDLSTNPKIDLTLDFGRKGDPAPAPVSPKVYENSKEVFNWGFSLGFLLNAKHVFIFESIQSGKATRLVHYEEMKGFFKSFAMNEETKLNMTKCYSAMNESLKKLCEQSS